VDIQRWEEANLGVRRNLRRRERRIKALDIEKSKSILDYGCGDGLNLKIFRKLGYNRIYGLDRSEGYLSKLRREFKVYSADACDTGLPPKSFDVVFTDSVLHHLDIHDALREVKRILKVGGEFCFIEPRDTFAREVLDFATLNPILASFCHLKSRRITLMEERETYENWSKQQPFLISILEKSGFEVVFYRKLLMTIMAKCVSKGEAAPSNSV